jgi:hypothetical protein
MSHPLRPNPASALHTLVPQALILQEDVQLFVDITFGAGLTT